MNRKYIAAVLVVLGVVVIIAVIMLWRRSPTDLQRLDGTSSPGQMVDELSPTTRSSPVEPSKSTEQKYNEYVQQAMKGLNQPLRFWGKLINQDGDPVAGVEVSYKARTAQASMFAVLSSADIYGKAISNNNGEFYIDAGKGDMLGLYGFAKDGYRLAYNTKTGFSYAASPEIHRPDMGRPVVFIMYQETAIEPLHHFSRRFELACDGTPSTIDLFSGKAASVGQLRVIFRRYPLDIRRGRAFQWSAEIEIVNGGLQKARAEGVFIAPADGYGAVIKYDFSPKQTGWDRGLRETFYLKTADGKFGRLELRLNADSQPPPASLFVESWLNPSGSRRLEYDPRKKAPMR